MDLKITKKPTSIVYELEDKSSNVVTIECNDDGTLKVNGPKKIISNAIGGRGDEDETEAWFQDKDVKTPSEAVSNVLEIINELLKPQAV